EPLEGIWRDSTGPDIDLHLGRRVISLSAGSKEVADERGQTYGYERLLLATGGTPRRLPFGDDHVIYFRTLADYRRLRALSDTGRRFAVIGGGFIGSELAAALAMNHKQVILIFPGHGICHRLFPRELSLFLNDYYREKGVEVWADDQVSSLQR